MSGVAPDARSDATSPAAARHSGSRYHVRTSRGALGNGAFGSVYNCVDKHTGEEHAVKVVVKTKVSSGDVLAARREASILQGIGQHQHLLQLLDCGEDSTNVYIVSPCVRGGNLKDALRRGVRYAESDARVLLRRLLSGVAHLHDRGVMHRDIKPQNILLQADGAAIPLNPVLIDFGFATLSETSTTRCGTPNYAAPEVLEPSAARAPYGRKCDLWSVGVVAFMVLSGGSQPYTLNGMRDTSAFKRPPEWAFECSASARSFVELMLTVDPKARPSAADALQHPWLNSTDGCADVAWMETSECDSSSLSAPAQLRD